MRMEGEPIGRSGHAWLIGMLLFALWTGAILWSYSARQEAIAAKERELGQLTVAVEEQTRRLLKTVELSLLAGRSWLVDHPGRFAPQEPAFIALVSELRRVSEGAIDLRLVDTEGGLHLIPAATRQPVANVRDLQPMQVQLDPRTRGFVIGEPLVSPVNGKWIIPVTLPVEQPDGRLMILSAIIDLDRITQVFEPQRLKPNGSITLLTSSGVTLFRTPAIEGAIGKSIAKAPDFIEHLSPIDRGRYRIKGAFDGVERVISHAHLAGYPVIVAVTASLDDALLLWRRDLMITLLLLAVATPLCLLFARRIRMAEHSARQKLEASERRFRALIEHAPDAILLYDPDAGRIVEANPGMEALFACPRNELLQGGVEHFYAPVQPDGLPTPESLRQARDRTLAGESVVVERHVHDKTGRAFNVEVRLDDISEDDRRLIRASFVDITARKQAEKELRDSEKQIRLLFNSTDDAILVYEADSLSGAPLGTLIEANDMACTRLGYTRTELLKLRFEEVLAPEALIRPIPGIKLVFERSAVFETILITKEARLIPVEINAHIFTLDDKTAVLAVARDISERQQAEKSLQLAASVFDSTQEGIMITDAANRIIDVNAAFTRITGYTRAEALQQTPRLLNSGHHDPAFFDAMWQAILRNDHWQGEMWNRRKDGELYAQRLTVSAVRDGEGKLTHYVGLFADITLDKRQKELLEHSAHNDALTGLPNRVLLADRMRQAMAQTQRSRSLLAICYIDLDGFKPINDALGHEVGDHVLLEVAKRFRDCLRGGDTAARIGGDEFVLLLLDLADEQECRNVLQRVLDTVAQPLGLDGYDRGVTASIGVTFYPNDDADADTLLRHADQAMYQAKQAGKGTYRLFRANPLEAATT